MKNCQEPLYKFSTISKPFKGILLDAYGVFWGGNGCGVLSGSKETMEGLVSSGKIVGILSNTTQLATREKEKFKSHGLVEGRHFHFFISSGEVAKQVLLNEGLPFETPKKKFWLFGSIHPKFGSHQMMFQNTSYVETQDIQEADFIYIAIPNLNGEDQTDPNLFRDELKKTIESGLPMVCTNPDRFAHEGNPPRPVVRQGSIAAIYEELGGRVYYIGKPYHSVYAEAMKLFSQQGIVDPKDILMVGDTPETDIRGARKFGMVSALVINTGIMAEMISRRGLDNVIRELPTWDYPDFFIECFDGL